ncbi:MAG: hypothetical protein J6Y94_04605 [Bacteriovoracaceae bacterium]|nr:hypothetical protein [Bacteriovoracaceae bacterium]
MAYKKHREFYKYHCTITNEAYTLTRKAAHPEELVSVAAWYELNPQHDDRPANRKTAAVMAETPSEPSGDGQ